MTVSSTGSTAGVAGGADGAVGLALSSSTGVISAAIGAVGSSQPRACATLPSERRHAEEISPLIERLLVESELGLADLEVLVVDRGPGRFTGLRVGLATVKALAFALDLPVVGLTSLEILAAVAERQRRPDNGLAAGEVTAVVDARRNEVFQQRFDGSGSAGEPQVGKASTLARSAVGLIVGDGVDRYRADYEAGAGPGARLILGVEIDAAIMLTAAGGRRPAPGSAVRPLYLREPDVNPNVKTRPRLERQGR